MAGPKPRGPRRRKGLVLIVGACLAGLVILAFWDRSESWPVERVVTRSGNPFQFGPDGRTLIVAVQSPNGNSFAAIDLESGREQAIAFDALFFGDARSPDRRLGLQSNFQGEVRVVDATTGAEIRRLPAESSPVSAVFAPEGGSVLVFDGPPDHCEGVRTWDLATGSVTSRPLSKPPGLVPSPLRGRSYVWLPSPDGRTLAYFDDAKVGIQLWDVATDQPLGRPLRTPTTKAANRFYSALAFTPDARFLLHGQPDGGVEVWDVAARTLVRVLAVQGPNDFVDTVVPSPDGRTVMVHSVPVVRGPMSLGARIVRTAVTRIRGRPEEDEVVLIDLATGRLLARSPGGQLLAFRPDSRSVAVGRGNRIEIHPVPTLDSP